MKKLFALLLAAVMCFSLAACGGTAETNDNDTQKQEVQSTEQTDTQQSEAEPVEQIIEITMDNWQEYFEINYYLSVNYRTNDFDEVTDTSLYLYPILELKKQYYNYVLDGAVEFDMDFHPSDITYNLEDFSFELIDCVSHPEATVDEKDFVRGCTQDLGEGRTLAQERIVDGKVDNGYIQINGDDLCTYVFPIAIEQNEDGTGYIEKCPTNIQITRIEGTLEYNN